MVQISHQKTGIYLKVEMVRHPTHLNEEEDLKLLKIMQKKMIPMSMILKSMS